MQLKWYYKNIIFEIRNSLYEFNSRTDIVKYKINKLEPRAIENTHTQEKVEKIGK